MPTPTTPAKAAIEFLGELPEVSWLTPDTARTAFQVIGSLAVKTNFGAECESVREAWITSARALACEFSECVRRTDRALVEQESYWRSFSDLASRREAALEGPYKGMIGNCEYLLKDAFPKFPGGNPTVPIRILTVAGLLTHIDMNEASPKSSRAGVLDNVTHRKMTNGAPMLGYLAHFATTYDAALAPDIRKRLRSITYAGAHPDAVAAIAP